MHITELEAGQSELNEKFEAALEHLEREAEDKDAEIVNANQEIQKLGQRVYELEDELEQYRDESARLREDDAVERERLESLTAALKEVGEQLFSRDSVLDSQISFRFSRNYQLPKLGWRK